MNEQRPLSSGFNPASTAEQVSAGLDLTDRVAVVTGGYSGIGVETARVLALRGARVIVPVRDPAKAQRTLSKSALGGLRVETLPMDLMDPASIDVFAAKVMEMTPALHILVNSAGIMTPPLKRDAEGHEAQFSTNHLGHFRLALRLWPVLAAANGARVVAVSSRGHRYGPVDFDDPDFERRAYDPHLAYGQSKTANALFARELDRRGAAHDVRAFSLHPGGIITPLSKHMDPAVIREMGYADADGRPVIDPAADKKTVEQGAATSVWCATSPLLEGRGGVYCENSDIAEAVSADDPRLNGVRPWARDPEAASRLWELSERMTGLSLPV